MEYKVSTLRDAGLDAKWSKTKRGAPILVARNPAANSEHQKHRWWFVDASMWDQMLANGIIDGFNGATVLGGCFSISV